VNPSTVAAADPRTPLDPASFPPLHPGVVGVLEDFLVLAGTEFFPAVPPCTGYQSTDDYTEDVPLELGYLPDGAEEQERYVSTCPDGTVLSAGYQYELTDGRTLSVAFSRAPHSFPIVLGDPSAGGISAVQVNSHRGLMIVPERNREAYTYAAVRFWVAEQYDTQKSGAFVMVGIVDAETPPEDLRALLMRIAEGVAVGSALLNP
jgi:hypothetical protein